ncbi:MAG TPA: YbaK/EbsC family protein [Acidobacteriota bacterium]|nr:YbaK/EbsC family protein [Acidobacteriota bacterium]
MPVRKLKEFLDQNRVKYVTISHSLAYTAQEIAASAHVSGKEMAKTVIIKVDGRMAMAVLPASLKVDFELLADAIDANKVELATEREFKQLFPDCELGAMPPFGNLYGMDVFVAESLSEHKEIVFNAGSHTELIRMSYADFQRLVQPQVVKLSVPA